mmetsp:Transcript_86153/g.206427  ORF Transcript_86153/g.206427 Transcript_86153/m.206427 type:complete len:401 (+) Transcript_86153:207-1409(+)
MRLDGYRQVLWNATERIEASRGDLCSDHLHVIVVLAVVQRDEPKGSWVHVAVCLLALLGETFDTIEAHQEVPKAIVPVQGVHVLHERGAVLLRGSDQGLVERLVAQKRRQELLIVSTRSEEVASKVWAAARVSTVRHVVGLHEVLLDDLLDVQAGHGHCHCRRQLQVIGVVGVHRPRLPDELHCLVDVLRAANNAPDHLVARRDLLQAPRRQSGDILAVRVAPLAPGQGVGLLPRVPIPEAGGEAQQHAEGHRGPGVRGVLSPPRQVVVHGVVQEFHGAIRHQAREHHGRGPLAGAPRGDLGLQSEVPPLVSEQPAVRGIPHHHGVLAGELPLLQDHPQGVPGRRIRRRRIWRSRRAPETWRVRPRPSERRAELEAAQGEGGACQQVQRSSWHHGDFNCS